MTRDITQLIAQMTLEEKASLCSGRNFWYMQGIERLEIPSIMLTDGPHGLRKQKGSSDHIGLNESVPATCFPTASALAATWDRQLVYRVGEALGEECRAEKVGVILGPGINIKRSPLCGRNFEYFSEDPYLSGELAKSHINGVQSKGIGTSLKHYSVNNQETRRMTIDVVVDERALREIYLPGYEIAVKEAQPWTVMCSYNRINGTYACEHADLMTKILKEEWGHEGLVVTDWGAMNDRVLGVKAGVELEMPGVGNGNDELIVAAVQSGVLDEAVVDAVVARLLALIFKADATLQAGTTVDHDTHHALARQVASESAVLLKNEDDILPIAQENKIALIGRFAKEPRYQGAGSSQVTPTRLDNLYDELCQLIGVDAIPYAPGYDETSDSVHQELIDEAVEVAKAADIVIVCAGLTAIFEVEGVDREHIELPPAHDALIAALAAAHQQVVVVLSNGSPVAMPWVESVAGILEAYLGGQAGAGGVADILLGRVNPSGKLAETFPLQLADNPSYHYFPGGPATVEYRESLYVGYRYYDTVGQPVLFPFGHGLSYTRFAYSNLQVSNSKISESDTVCVSCTVKNIGAIAGKEIVQFYVRDVTASVFRPQKELKGFAKVALEPGEEATITVELNRRAFAYYSPAASDWVVEPGQFEILVGASSQDLRLQTTVEVTAVQPAPTESEVPDIYFNFPKNQSVSQRDFAALLQRPLPANRRDSKGNFTINTPISDMQGAFLGRQLFRLMQRQTDQLLAGEVDPVMQIVITAIMQEAPLRLMTMFGDGKITRGMLEGLLDLLNGRYWSGAKTLLGALRTKA